MDPTQLALVDLVGLLNYILPGLLASWVFHGLTAHPKQTPFERIVQALIFTAFVQGITSAVSLIPEATKWVESHSFLVSSLVAIPLGLMFAWLANTDCFHWCLRLVRITRRTSHPSEWFSAFARDKRHVILHLKDRRRLFGWPFEWPDQSDKGHFVLMDAAWILDDNSLARLLMVERMVVSAVDVEMIEIMKTDEEISKAATVEELQKIENTLVALNEEERNGKQGTTAATTAPEAADARGRIERKATSNDATASRIASPSTPEKVIHNGHYSSNGRRRKKRR